MVERPIAWVAWLVVVNVVWGASYSVLKLTVDHVSPRLTAALGVCMGTAVLWTIRALRPRRPQVAVGDRLRIALLGNIGLTANVLLTFEGIARATAVDASLLIVGETIFTLLLALALGERADRRRLAAAALGVGGMVLVVLDGVDPRHGASGRLVGVMLLLAATLADAIYNVCGAAFTRRYDALTVLSWAMKGTLPVWLVILAWGAARGQLPALEPSAALGVIWVGCVQYTLCFWAWFALIGRAGASLGAVTVAAQPLAGVLVARLALAERPGAAALLGALVVVVALWTASAHHRAASWPPAPRRGATG